MPRAAKPRLKLVRNAEACEALGITRRTFWRRWAAVFTDARHPDERGPGCEFKVFDDELSVAVEKGGGPAARVAVLNYRGRVGRK